MIIKNAKIYTETHEFVTGDVVVTNGKFSQVHAQSVPETEEIVHADGLYDSGTCGYPLPRMYGSGYVRWDNRSIGCDGSL